MSWADYSSLIDDAELSIKNIITSSKDSDTGTVNCSGDLDAKMSGQYVSVNILYKIEKNSDGQLVATVWGL